MPLQRGSSRRSFIANIRELMHAWRRTGRIGTSRPASAGKADKQAVAIAFRKQRESR